MAASSAGAATNVVIVGGGPAGLLLAHYLLQRGKTYTATVYEARGDPRLETSRAKSRQYSIGLSARGRHAIQGVDDLWPVVQKRGVETHQFVLHLGGKPRNLKRSPDKPSLLINRGVLTATLLEELERRYPTSRFKAHFGTRCARTDFQSRTAHFSSKDISQATPYDLLVGADGVRSEVRSEFLRQRDFDFEQRNYPFLWKVLHAPRPEGLAGDAVHSFRYQGTVKGKALGALAIPTPDNEMCVLVDFTEETAPKEMFEIQSAPEMKAFLERFLPAFTIPEDAAAAFLEQRASRYMQIKCSRYHDSEGRAVLIGDAAHATSAALGQGCNSSLQDSVALDKVLQEEKDDIDAALPRYSQQQVPEGLALAELSENNFPKARWLAAVTLAKSIATGQLSNWLPELFSPPVQALTSETLVPYSEIAARNRRWLNVIKSSNLKLKQKEVEAREKQVLEQRSRKHR